MKTKKNNKMISEKEWADAAAWLSGEDNADDRAARLLLNEETGLMRKWNDIKMTDPDYTIDVEKAWNKLEKRITEEGEKDKIRYMPSPRLFVRIAAAITVLIAFGWILFNIARTDGVTIATAPGEKNLETVLPDGSKVFLNADSYITYKESFGRNSRKVTLEGEAFFDITPDPAKPFVIDAGKANVKVLGTSFNVITDNGNHQVEVFVKTGTVMLSNNDGTENLTLKPGFIGTISGQESSSRKSNDKNYLAWHTGELIYDSVRLETVFQDLKHAYSINISTEDDAINNYMLSTVFSNEPHDTIIQAICTTFRLQSAKEGDTYLLSRREKN